MKYGGEEICIAESSRGKHPGAGGKYGSYFYGLVTLNESGAFLWKHMEKNRTREELVQEVLQEYEVSEEQARLDIGQFLTYLAKAGVLE